MFGKQNVRSLFKFVFVFVCNVCTMCQLFFIISGKSFFTDPFTSNSQWLRQHSDVVLCNGGVCLPIGKRSFLCHLVLCLCSNTLHESHREIALMYLSHQQDVKAKSLNVTDAFSLSSWSNYEGIRCGSSSCWKDSCFSDSLLLSILFIGHMLIFASHPNPGQMYDLKALGFFSIYICGKTL